MKIQEPEKVHLIMKMIQMEQQPEKHKQPEVGQYQDLTGRVNCSGR